MSQRRNRDNSVDIRPGLIPGRDKIFLLRENHILRVLLGFRTLSIERILNNITRIPIAMQQQ
jgi:hypothetical protein